MILLLYCICQDQKIPENELLINYLSSPSQELLNESSVETDKLKSLLFQTSQVERKQPTGSFSKIEEISEFKSLQAFQEWRVNALQHIKQPFHSSYR